MNGYNDKRMHPAANEKTFRLPETRVWASNFGAHSLISASAWLSSTLQWGCEYSCDRTASGKLDQRFYNSVYGRFMSPDPYKQSGGPGDPGSWNRYSYVQNDPINYVDPTGQLRCIEDEEGNCASGDLSVGGGGIFYSFVPYGPTNTTYYYNGPNDGGGGGGGAAPQKTPCEQALAVAGKDAAGVARALTYKTALMAAASKYNLDWTVLAAIGVRETDFMNVNHNGMYGVFQINISGNHVSASAADDISQAIGIAAGILSFGERRFSNLDSQYGLDPVLGGLAFYDGAKGGRAAIIDALTSGSPVQNLDRLTDGGNYVSNVLALTKCFK